MNLTFDNVDHLCSAVDLSLDLPVIDLSSVTFFKPFALVYLGMFLRYHNCRDKFFHVVLPKRRRALSYLNTQNFWARFNFNPSLIRREDLRRLTNSTSLNDIVDIENKERIAEEIAGEVFGVLGRHRLRIRAGPVAEMLSELVDNFAQHSNAVLGVFAMQYYPQLRRVEFAFGDCGIGIRASLASNPTYAHLASRPHHEAAEKAFEPGVSRRAEGGTGLTDVDDEAVNLGGQLILATGDGFVRIRRDGRVSGEMFYDLPGVQIELSLPVGGL